MRFSVVIHTYNRGGSLRTTLAALRYQTYADFEVVVVNGPSTDQTAGVLEEYRGAVRAYSCPEVNLSKSRNLGIAAAAGEVVAFIDDDGVPDPGWLAELARAYADPEVGGAGGCVYDHTGYALQFAGGVCDRRGDERPGAEPPFTAYQAPGSDPFVHLLGTNCSFRRRCLEQIGGFDEEFEYFLDETEVCLRVTDAGSRIAFRPGAVVYHKFLASHLRNDRKALRDPFPVIKNKVYFALRAAPPRDRVAGVLCDCAAFAGKLLRDARLSLECGRLTAAEFRRFDERLDEGFRAGVLRGLTGGRKGAVIPPADPARFKPYPTLRPRGRRLNLCLLAPDFPAGPLPAALARRGHEVHVVTGSPDQNRVDFEDGVWVHRMVPDVAPPRLSRGLPPGLVSVLTAAAAAHREVKRLHAFRVPDVVAVESPDGEALFCLADGDLTCVRTPPGGDVGEALLAFERAAGLPAAGGRPRPARRREAELDALAEELARTYRVRPADVRPLLMELYVPDPGSRRADYAARLSDWWHLPGREFLQRIYPLLLGRSADEVGLDGFGRQLARGVSRLEVVRALALSEEARARNLDISWLGNFRPPQDPPEGDTVAGQAPGWRRRVKRLLRGVPLLGRALRYLKRRLRPAPGGRAG